MGDLGTGRIPYALSNVRPTGPVKGLGGGHPPPQTGMNFFFTPWLRPRRRAGSATFAAALENVTGVADGSEIRIAVVIARTLVVDLTRGRTAEVAPMPITFEHPLTFLRPIGGESPPTCASGPRPAPDQARRGRVQAWGPPKIWGRREKGARLAVVRHGSAAALSYTRVISSTNRALMAPEDSSAVMDERPRAPQQVAARTPVAPHRAKRCSS